MKPISKPNGGRGTSAQKTSAFTRAVWKLTGFYSLGVLLILVVFNVLVYALFVNELHIERDPQGVFAISLKTDDGAEELEVPIDRPPEGLPHEEVAQQIRTRLIETLFIVCLTLLLAVFIIAYVWSRKTLRPIEEAYQRERRFVADAAHELRTPLAVMKAGAEVALAREQTGEAYKKIIADMLGEVERLTTMSNNLLFLARNEHGGETKKTRLDFSLLVTRTCELMKPYASAKEITISETIVPGVMLVGYESDLSRMLMNVLKNAVDYNKPEGSVTVTLSSAGGAVELSVADTGVGIAPADLPHVFDRFFKASAARSQNESGTGLGLSLVQEIVKEHGGSVSIDSAPGSGTTVRITFYPQRAGQHSSNIHLPNIR